MVHSHDHDGFEKWNFYNEMYFKSLKKDSKLCKYEPESEAKG